MGWAVLTSERQQTLVKIKHYINKTFLDYHRFQIMISYKIKENDRLQNATEPFVLYKKKQE